LPHCIVRGGREYVQRRRSGRPLWVSFNVRIHLVILAEE